MQLLINFNQIQDGGICLVATVTKCVLKMMIDISVPIVQILQREPYLGNTNEFPAVIFILLKFSLDN
jgi:hypothetical protein